jgi:hypothetical protein
MAKPNPQDILATEEQEDFSPRGRKRRQTSESATSPPILAQNSPSGSTTMRGRGRRRSTSGISSQSDNASKPSTLVYTQPGRKCQTKLLKHSAETKKRSKSPSRSRIKGVERTPRRRRQRTTSRSRSHGTERGRKGGLEVDDRKERDGRSSRQGAHDAPGDSVSVKTKDG